MKNTLFSGPVATAIVPPARTIKPGSGWKNSPAGNCPDIISCLLLRCRNKSGSLCAIIRMPPIQQCLKHHHRLLKSWQRMRSILAESCLVSLEFCIPGAGYCNIIRIFTILYRAALYLKMAVSGIHRESISSCRLKRFQ